MSLNRLLKAAIPMALVCGPLLSQDVFEFHGYMRAGAGRSSNGGEQVNFYLPGATNDPSAGPGYRLGNEIDNYIELAMDVRAYDKAGTTFKLHFRPTFRQFNDARDASADAGGDLKTGYQDWKLGASYTVPEGVLKGVEFGAYYSGNDAKSTPYTDLNGYDTAKDRGVVYVKKTF